MKHILTRTIERTLRPLTLILTILVGYLTALFVIGEVGSCNCDYATAQNTAALYQHLAIFFGLDGVLLMFVSVANGCGLIAEEVHEGTFRLLAAKPNSRSEILLAKLLGALISDILVLLLGLTSYYLVTAFSAMDGNLFRWIFSFAPCYLLYGLLVILIFTALSVLLSCIFKRKIAALLPLLALVILILGFFPIFRFINDISALTSQGMPKLLDLNYQFASMFRSCVELRSPIAGSVSQLSGSNYLVGLFHRVKLDSDVVRIAYPNDLLKPDQSLNPLYLLVAYLTISLAAIAASFVILRRKDI